MPQSRIVSALRVKTAVCLLLWAGAGVVIRADQVGSKPQPPPMIVVRVPFFEDTQKWFQLVMAHDIGQWDKSAATVAGMNPYLLARVRDDLRMIRNLLDAAAKGETKIAIYGRVLALQSLAPLMGLSSDDLPIEPLQVFADSPARQIISRIMTRAAMLHTRVAMAPEDDMPEMGTPPPGDPTSRRPPERWANATLIRDGQPTRIVDRAIHWAVAREALDIVGPPRAGSAAARAWYEATTAYLQTQRDYASLVPQLEHARELFPTDARVFLFSGAASENLAAPPVQAAVVEAGMPIVGLERKDVLIKSAETYYRRALVLDPTLAPARLRLGRLLDGAGRHDEAAALLADAEAALTDPVMRYDAALFLGRAEEARGRDAEARAAYTRARTQFPLAQSPSLALAAIQWRMGEQDAAMSGLQLLARTNPMDTQSDPWWRYDICHAGDVQTLFARLDRAVSEVMK